MDILKELKTSWPAEYKLQPNNATQRRDVIAIQSLKKRSSVEIERLMEEAQSFKADAERYRWLKNSITDGLFIAQYNGSFSRWTGDKADEVIDKSMKD